MADLIKSNDKKEIGVAAEMIFLLNERNGRILPWTPILSVNPNYSDCDRHGNPIGSPDGGNEYIQQETKNFVGNMKSAGATPDTIQDFGRHLTDMGETKFRALENRRKEQGRLGYRCVTDDEIEPIDLDLPIPEPVDPILKRLYDKIDIHAAAVQAEIQEMTLDALGIAFFGHKVKAQNRNVSFEFKRKALFNKLEVGRSGSRRKVFQSGRQCGKTLHMKQNPWIW